MTLLNSFSLKPAIPRWILGTIFIVALIGFADAAYLTAMHYQGKVPPCSLVEGCEIVTTSQYSVIGPVPVALLGTIFYFFVLAILIAYWDSNNKKILALLPFLGVIGFLASLYFVGLQLFVIKALCLYCIVSAGTSTAIFALAVSLVQFKAYGK